METLLLIALALLLIPIAVAGMSLAPWVPARKKDFERIEKHLKLRDGDVFYELGSGEGRLSRFIAGRNPMVQVKAIEMALPLHLLSRLHLLLRPIPNLKLIYGNALNYDLSDADAIYTFATISTINRKLKPKFLRELKKGCTVVSYEFGIREWEGIAFADEPETRGAKIYIYVI